MDDIITEVDGDAVTEAVASERAHPALRTAGPFELTVERDGRERTIRVRLAARMDDGMMWHPEPFQEEPLLVPDQDG